MRGTTPRVAFFPDSYLEVNGAAMTSKRLSGFAEKNGYPFLCIHAGEETAFKTSGSLSHLSLKRSAISLPMDEGLKYDPLFNRHIKLVEKALADFQPDVLHLTGLNDVSIIAAWLAYKYQYPLVGSWHTNLHEFASRRLEKMLRFLPKGMSSSIARFSEKKIFEGATLYYKMPKVILAPNQELIDALTQGTNRPAYLMLRGVDTQFFSPAKRSIKDSLIRLGFVGRLRAEKNVRLLADLEKKLIEAGRNNFRFLIVGEGNEREWLEKNMQRADFTGFLDGEKLAEAYANMDIFIFPSETDAFGNVAQEAMCSGVPAIVTAQGGPKFIIKSNETGYVAENLEDFLKYSLILMDSPEKLDEMKKASREYVLERSWDSVFERVYEAYCEAIRISAEKKMAAGKAHG